MARIHEIADALALHLGGKQVPMNRDGEFFDWCARVDVDMPAPSIGYTLYLSAKTYGADAGKITVTLGARAYKGDAVSIKEPWPSARVNGNRDLQAVVADVARRVCNTPEAAAALAAHAAALAARDARARGVDGAMAELLASSKAHESGNYPRDTFRGRLFSSPGGVYFSATVAPDSVSFDRIGSMSVAQAKAVIKILESDA